MVNRELVINVKVQNCLKRFDPSLLKCVQTVLKQVLFMFIQILN